MQARCRLEWEELWQYGIYLYGKGPPEKGEAGQGGVSGKRLFWRGSEEAWNKSERTLGCLSEADTAEVSTGLARSYMGEAQTY